jgi:hypothetical protein
MILSLASHMAFDNLCRDSYAVARGIGSHVSKFWLAWVVLVRFVVLIKTTSCFTPATRRSRKCLSLVPSHNQSKTAFHSLMVDLVGSRHSLHRFVSQRRPTRRHGYRLHENMRTWLKHLTYRVCDLKMSYVLSSAYQEGVCLSG